VARPLGGLALRLWLPAALFLVWWYATENSTSPFSPPLRTVVDVSWDTLQDGKIFDDIAASLIRFGWGLLIACAGGILLGLVLGLWPFARRATAPIVDFLRSIPGPAIISVTVVLVGIDDKQKISVIAFSSIWPVLLNTIDGVRGVDAQQLEMASAYKLRRRDQVLRIVLPAASPQIFAGLRISLTIALAVMVFAEMFTGTNGLGFFIMFAQNTYRVPEMYTGIVLLGLLGYAVNVCFLVMEARVLRWHRGWRMTAQDPGGAR
jgi:ABC-type nitrate/sulfonate/bicarbonate transport system permease component